MTLSYTCTSDSAATRPQQPAPAATQVQLQLSARVTLDTHDSVAHDEFVNDEFVSPVSSARLQGVLNAAFPHAALCDVTH